MRRYILVFFALCAFTVTGIAQQVEGAAQKNEEMEQQVEGRGQQASEAINSIADRTILALSEPEYPVTPGDVYRLSYLKSSTPDAIRVVVEGDGTINFGFFGRIDASGMRFRDIKALIEKKVSDSYLGSSPSLLIDATGIFQVKVDGEVNTSSYAPAWGLTRLSSVIGSATERASKRAVAIVHPNGIKQVYDLFLASRYGNFDQDPFVKPGDRIVLGRAERIVTIGGAVERPGTYQLLPKEQLDTLVERYGGGLLANAKPELTRLTRRAEPGRPNGESVLVDVHSGVELFDGDTIVVPSMDTYLDVVYIEGAIKAPVVAANTGNKSDTIVAANGDLSTEYRVERLSYRTGYLLSSALRSIVGRLLPTAALRQGFVQRPGEVSSRPVDLEALLFHYNKTNDLELKAGDRVIIPFGAFEVFVTGETIKSAFVSISGLTRLSSIVGPLVTPFSSLRAVRVISPSGDEAIYDLFKAQRDGDQSQDPFLKPGDRVSLKRLDRSVSIQGAVRRPGTYQLLHYDKLKELVEVYGGGFTEVADSARLDLARYVSSNDPSGERRLLSYKESADEALVNLDVITVPTLQDILPNVFFEGAVSLGGGTGITKPEPGVSNRYTYRFLTGELLANAIRVNRDRFTAEADLEKGYILRSGTRIPINLSRYLYDKNDNDRTAIVAGDTIVIPFKQYFVTVGGAVINPGRYPYVPDRGWRYYVGLAGGANEEINSGYARKIFSVEGKKKGPEDSIDPEDSIVLASNSFFYYLGKIAVVLTPLTTLLTFYLTFKSLLGL
jgi:protein involved in polysaccharide export with SLBB domain